MINARPFKSISSLVEDVRDILHDPPLRRPLGKGATNIQVLPKP